MSFFGQRAKSCLVFYFELVARKAGIRWDPENVAEVESIVDNIIKAVKEELGEESEVK